MLVLSRRVGEAIVISDQVHVRVVQVRGKCVRLAIAAPDAVPVHREEIYRQRREFAPAGESMAESLPETV